jgi:hypothetical protein
MKKFRLFYLTLLVMVLAYSGSVAQSRGSRTMDSTQVQERVRELTQVLSLSDNQQAAILQLEYGRMQAQRDLFNQHMGDREGMRSAMLEYRAKYQQTMESLLDEEQVKKFREYRDEQVQNWRQGRGAQGNGPRQNRRP